MYDNIHYIFRLTEQLCSFTDVNAQDPDELEDMLSNFNFTDNSTWSSFFPNFTNPELFADDFSADLMEGAPNILPGRLIPWEGTLSCYTCANGECNDDPASEYEDPAEQCEDGKNVCSYSLIVSTS